jgi:[ribosomal protein S5]-alanine N-acetyltransferase
VRARRLRPERPWQEHERLYRDLFADPAVAAALWPGRLADRGADRRAAEILSGDIEHWHARSFGPWVFFETETGMFVGRGGLRSAAVAGSQCVEILYAVRSDAWGRGYATDIAALAVEHARRLGISEVVGLVAIGNRASQRVLEKTGMRLQERVEHAGLPHLLGRLRTVH